MEICLKTKEHKKALPNRLTFKVSNSFMSSVCYGISAYLS